MRGVWIGALLGLVVGVTLGALGVLVLHDSRPEPRPPVATEPPAYTRQADPVPDRRVPRHPRPPIVEPRESPDVPAFPEGRATLRIGDHYRFGDDAIRSEDAEYDLRCLDLHHDATFATPNGSKEARSSGLQSVLPASATERARMVPSAPPELSDRAVVTRVKAAGDRTGVALVRGADGRTYRVHIDTLHAAPDALERWVEIAYVEVPVEPEGGHVVAPVVIEDLQLDPGLVRDLARLKERGRFASESLDSYQRPPTRLLTALGETVTFGTEIHAVVRDRLSTEVVLDRGGSLVFADGIGETGKLRWNGYSGALIRGDMAGEIDIQSYGSVGISGDLTGTVAADSYATIVLEGDLVGRLELDSYVDVLIRGRILGELAADGACWSDVWISPHFGTADLARLTSDSSVTLHLRRSDLAIGTHEKHLGWRAVIVGEEAWQTIPE